MGHFGTDPQFLQSNKKTSFSHCKTKGVGETSEVIDFANMGFSDCGILIFLGKVSTLDFQAVLVMYQKTFGVSSYPFPPPSKTKILYCPLPRSATASNYNPY